jgi:hypothetical protein
MKPIACSAPTGCGLTPSPMRRPSGKPSSWAVAPPGWSAATSMLARVSAGTRSSGCANLGVLRRPVLAPA